jgi:hypothetical protein
MRWFWFHMRNCEYRKEILSLGRQVGELEAKFNMLAHLLGYRWFTTPKIEAREGWQYVAKEGQPPKREMTKPPGEGAT